MNADRFSLEGRVAVVTGGYGVIGGTLASGLAAAGARTVIVGRRRDAAEEKAEAIRQAGGDAIAVLADVVDEAQVRRACETTVGARHRIDILINAAGGSVPAARNDNRSIFEVPMVAFDDVLRLNLHGTVVHTMVFGQQMATQGT